MSAPLLNASLFIAPGKIAGLGGGVGAAGQASGALAGFEALIAALFGQPAQADGGGPLAAPPFQALVQASTPGAGRTPSAAQTLVDPLAAKSATTDDPGAAGDSDGKADDGQGADAEAALVLLAAGVALPAVAQPGSARTAATGDAPAAAVGDEAPAKAPTPQTAAVFDPGAAADCAKTTLPQANLPQAMTAAFAAAEPPAPDTALAALAQDLTQQAAAPVSPAQAKTAGPTAPKTATTAPELAATGPVPASAPEASAAGSPAQAKAEAPPAAPAETPVRPPAEVAVQTAAPQVALAQPAQPAAPSRAETPPPSHRGSKDKAAGKVEIAGLTPGKSAQAPGQPKRVEGAKGAAEVAPAVGKAAAAGQAQDEAETDAPAETSDVRGPAGSDQTQTQQAAQGPQAQPAAQAAVRGAPQTVANLAAQIVRKLEAKTTRFDVQLDPAGLGKVDVRVEIGAEGRITAALACHNPDAAKALQARSGELQQALEQAGFDISGGLSFSLNGGGQGQAGAGQNPFSGQNDAGQGFRGRAFASAMEAAGDAAQAAADGALRLRMTPSSGVDIRI